MESGLLGGSYGILGPIRGCWRTLVCRGCQGCVGGLAGSVGTQARRGIGSIRRHWGIPRVSWGLLQGHQGV